MRLFLFLFLVIFYSLPSFAQEISFMQAWDRVIQKSDALKAKKEDLNSAQYRKEAARDLYLPEISISGFFTHLQKPVEFGGKSLLGNMDKNSLHTLLEGISKASSNAAYHEALQNGKTLEEAMKIAQQNANNILSSFANIKNSIQNSSFTIAKQNSFNSSITALWPIYTGGKIQAAQIVAKGDIDEAIAILELAKLEQFETLAKIYFGVNLLEEILETKKDAQNTFKKHLDQALKLEKYGQIAKIERLSAQVNYDKAMVEAKKAKKELEIGQIALSQMIHLKGAKPTTKLFISNNLENLEVFRQKTIDSYPVFSLYDAKKVKTDGLIMAKKSSYYPSLFLFGNHNVYREKSRHSKNIPDWLVGAGATYTIFDNKGRKKELEATRSMQMKIEHLKNQTKRDINLLVEKTYRQAFEALEEYHGLSSSIELGYENVRLHEKSFAQGLSTSTGVVDAQLLLQGAKTQRAVASYNFILALSKLLALSNQTEKFLQYR